MVFSLNEHKNTSLEKRNPEPDIAHFPRDRLSEDGEGSLRYSVAYITALAVMLWPWQSSAAGPSWMLQGTQQCPWLPSTRSQSHWHQTLDSQQHVTALAFVAHGQDPEPLAKTA